MAKAKIDDLLPLPAIRLVLNSCAIPLEPLIHQVSSLPKETDLEYYFVPAERMKLFAPYHRPGKPFRNLKLLNYGQPAIAVSFYNKHKYKVVRDVTPVVARQILQERRDELYSRSYLEQLSAEQQRQLRQLDSLLKDLYHNPDELQFCISNYHQYYRYWYCSYRFFDDEDRTKTSTHNEHLLKHTQRTSAGPASERLNIIFVDMAQISRPVPYDNKLVDRELEAYDVIIPFGLSALYAKKNSYSAQFVLNRDS